MWSAREYLAEILYAKEGFSRSLDLPAELRCRIYQEYSSFRPHPVSEVLRIPHRLLRSIASCEVKHCQSSGPPRDFACCLSGGPCTTMEATLSSGMDSFSSSA